MKNSVKLLGIIALVAVIGFSLSGCGDDSSGDPSSPGSGNNNSNENGNGNNNSGNNGSNEGNDEIITNNDADRTITLTKELHTLLVTISHGEWKDDFFSDSDKISFMLQDICDISTTGDITSTDIRYRARISEGYENTLYITLVDVSGPKSGIISFTLKDSGTRHDLLNVTTGFVGSSSIANWTATGSKGPYSFQTDALSTS
jgi:hypothetical protein